MKTRTQNLLFIMRNVSRPELMTENKKMSVYEALKGVVWIL